MNKAWLTAVRLAVWHWIKHRPFSALVVLPWNAAATARLIWLARRTPIAARERLSRRRLTECRACPIYNPKLQTCGTPGEWNDELPIGCWCFLPVASQLPDKQCWLNPTDVMSAWSANSMLKQ